MNKTPITTDIQTLGMGILMGTQSSPEQRDLLCTSFATLLNLNHDNTRELGRCAGLDETGQQRLVEIVHEAD